MKLAPEDLYQKLEFDKILEIVQSYCQGPIGRRMIQTMEPHTQKFILDRMLLEVVEMTLSINEQHHFPLSTYPDISEELRMLEIPGFVLSEQQLFLMSRSIRVIYRIFQFFKADKQEMYPTLYDVIRDTSFDDYLMEKIDQIIDEEGHIKPNASPELMRIRRLQLSKRKELDKVFRSIINNFKSKGLLKDNEESFRNGRRVLAVPAEYKRQVKGIIHDESATGKTAFVEPEAIIHINNDIFDLEREEKREIYRILREVSEQLSAYVPILKGYQGIIGRYDLINAKAQLAKTMNGQAPKLIDAPHFGLKTALHPLLYLKNKKAGKKTVPFDLTFLNNNRVLVLSGPNAGGKSISLKAVGLLQLMVQCGMLVPVDPKSEMGVFQNIFIDMGDQQSLEDELSTYSSRLKNMKDFLAEANKRTLILIDEFGSGTDPKIGGSIAEAVLNAFHKKKVFGFITTHYSNLKHFAFKTKGIINGSMTFDKDTLSPTYELVVGRPGSSYAYEIAQKSGLPADIIGYAKKKTGKNEKAIDELLVQLQAEKQELSQKVQKLEDKQQQLDKLIKAYERMSNEFEFKRKKLKLEQKEQALQESARTNRQLERIIREIREEKNAEKAKELLKKTKSERKSLEKEVVNINEDLYHKKKTGKVEDRPIREGDFVRLVTGGDTAKVESIRKQKAVVVVNHLRMEVKLRDLVLAGSPVTAPVKGKINLDTLHSNAHFVNKLDLRGMRREEAMKNLESFVDEALIANGEELRIIHGKGDGILRKAVRSKLREYKAVKEMRFEEPELGGDGVTIVSLG